MAFDVTKPATTDNYLTQFTQGIRANLLALAVGLDSVQSSFTGAVPTYAKRYNRSSKAWEEYNGTSWELLPFGNILAENTLTGTTLTSYGVGGGGGLLQLRSPGNGAVGARLEMNADSNLYLVNNQSQGIALGTVGVIRTVIDNTGTLYPQATNSYDLGRVSNNWRNIYAQTIRVQELITFYGGSGNGQIYSNNGTWGMYYRPSVNGTSGCHVWTDAAGNGLMSVSSAGVLNVDTVSAGGTLRLPAAAGQSFFFAGNGDNGTYATHNIKTRLHWGWGLEDYSGTVRGVYDARTGIWDVKGGYRVNGVDAAGIGVNQSWQEVTGSRLIGPTYTNTTGRTIVVAVRSALPAYSILYGYVGGHRILFLFNNTAEVVPHMGTIIVPAGATYQFYNGTLQQWYELR